MSNEALLSAYRNGDLGRRQLVRRLVAGGVTMTAALAYAGLAAAPAQADPSASNSGLSAACENILGGPADIHVTWCGG